MPDAPTRTTADAHFSRLLRIEAYIRARRKRQFTRVQSSYERAVVAAYFAAHPKRKRRDFNDIATSEKKADRAIVQPILAKWKATADAEYEKYKSTLDTLDRLLDSAADAITLVPLPNTIYTHYSTHDTYTYISQGFGARRYAQAAAERSADKPRHLNVPVHVVERPYGYYKSAPLSPHHAVAFDVWVALNPLHTAALKRKYSDGPSFVESVRLCWKRGVNPRVYWPMLPHDFESKHSLDYFGNYRDDVAQPWSLADLTYLWRDMNGTMRLWGIKSALKHGPDSIRDIDTGNRHGWVAIEDTDTRLDPLRAAGGIPDHPGESSTVADWLVGHQSDENDPVRDDQASPAPTTLPVDPASNAPSTPSGGRLPDSHIRVRVCALPSAAYLAPVMALRVCNVPSSGYRTP